MPPAKVAPSVDLFEETVEQIASDPGTAAHSPDWIRQAAVLGGEKTRILRYIWAHAPANGGAPRVLDVGAQIGVFPLYAARTGCRAAGVDYNLFTSVYAAVLAEHGVDYRSCDVASEALPFPDASFDAVTYTDVIEHHSFSPKKVLLEIHRVLAPGGLLIISTPNHASLYNRILLLLGKSVLDKFSYFFEFAADQPTYLGHHREYTRSELRYALEKTGFQIRECRVVDDDLRSLIRYLRRRKDPVLASDVRVVAIRALGEIWSAARLPFGRVLRAVAQKPIH